MFKTEFRGKFFNFKYTYQQKPNKIKLKVSLKGTDQTPQKKEGINKEDRRHWELKATKVLMKTKVGL